jgi:hypothetical protein
VNDFIDRGRVKKVYIQGESDAAPCRRISANGSFAAATAP